MKKIENIRYYINKKYNRLTIKSVVGEIKGKSSTKIKCQCECGKLKVIRFDYVVNGRTKSCGCYRQDNARKQSEAMTTHNLTNTRLYSIYRAMKKRCYDYDTPKYKYYGGRGIKICSDWLDDIQNFARWSYANGYNENLTIDRIDNNGNYEPSNCQWVDQYTQQNNRRNNIKIEYNNEIKTLSQWSEKLGIDYFKLYYKIINKDMTIDNILKELKEKK